MFCRRLSRQRSNKKREKRSNIKLLNFVPSVATFLRLNSSVVTNETKTYTYHNLSKCNVSGVCGQCLFFWINNRLFDYFHRLLAYESFAPFWYIIGFRQQSFAVQFPIFYLAIDSILTQHMQTRNIHFFFIENEDIRLLHNKIKYFEPIVFSILYFNYLWGFG